MGQGALTTAECVTPALLTDVLRRSGVICHAEVRAIRRTRFGAEAGYTSTMTRFELDYTESEPRAPATLVGKFTRPNPVSMVPFAHEAGFYEDLAAGANLPAPRCYATGANREAGTCLVLLEDISHRRTIDLVAGCGHDDVELVLDELARMHRQWWARPELEELPWMLSAEHWAGLPNTEWWESYPRATMELLPERAIPESYFEIGRRFAVARQQIFRRMAETPRTLLHNDVHADNLVFGRDQDETPVVFFDWEFTTPGRGPRDVAYFLISSVPVELRRRHEEAWLQRYHALLVDGGVAGYSFEDCWLDYRLGAFGKMLVTVNATVCYDNTSAPRRAWRAADLERLLAFCEDHAVAELL